MNKIKDMLKSRRFWMTIIAGIAYCLQSQGIITQDIANAIYGIAGINITTQTIDKLSQRG